MIALGLFATGLLLSAFFSGTETGMYRISRTRLMLDGMSGSWAPRMIVWLINHPSYFVATTLLGNNVANYMVSAAVVWAAIDTVVWITGDPTTSTAAAELIGPILMTPVVFVVGELAPKHLYYRAPYRLITLTRPAVLAAAALCWPVSMALSMLGQALQRTTGQTPFRIRLEINRGELNRLIRDGHEAGILAAGQRALTTSLFEIGSRNAVSYGVPPERLAVVDWPVDTPAALAAARRANHPIVLVRKGERISGFVYFADLLRHAVADPNVTDASGDGEATAAPVHPVVSAFSDERHLALLMRMNDAGAEVAVLYDRATRTHGRGSVKRRGDSVDRDATGATDQSTSNAKSRADNRGTAERSGKSYGGGSYGGGSFRGGFRTDRVRMIVTRRQLIGPLVERSRVNE